VIERRYLNGPATRKTIGAELAISAERVRQIELTALAKLKKISEACTTQ
jgi:DNA-directed RNA polymerase sigma subunit (sigma70/sigma32)